MNPDEALVDPNNELLNTIMDGHEQIKAEAPPATSEERGERDPADSDPEAQSLQETLGLPEQTRETEAALATLYGSSFPLLNSNPDEKDWIMWAQDLWTTLGAGVQRRLHLVERNRLYKYGIQWITSNNFGPWSEPKKPRDAARIVENCIAPALNQRTQIVSEQRPGFRVRPVTNDPDDLRKANAKQRALEYQYDQQGMQQIIREATTWAGTDGVSFLELYWDPDAGPWHEASYGQAQEGQEGQQAEEAPQGPMGDVRCRVRRIEQVRVSSNAKANQRPWLWIVRDVMSQAEAVRIYGPEVSDQSDSPAMPDALLTTNYPMIKGGFPLPQVDELLLNQKTVERFTIYCEKSLGLPKGLTMVVVGQKLVFQGPLMFATAPMVRWTDGYPDPAFYPMAEMELWIECQQRINAIKSKWTDNVRLNAGPKLLAKENSISTETLVAGNMSVITAKGLGDLNAIVRPIESFSIGNDAKELLAAEIKRFEDLSGWNDVSRGMFAPDQSGRAILAIREQLERTFAPAVNAAALAMTDWGKMTCAVMAYGYDYPRYLGIEGTGRPDLAEAITQDDMDGVADVFIDPETLMPMPQSLKLFLLKDMYTMGLMDVRETRRRMPFGNVRDLSTPDEDQEARARRVCQAIRKTGNPLALPLLWQDDEAIHQDILQRELILDDTQEMPIRMAANQRWMMLANQSMMKMGMGGPMPPGGGAPQGGGQSQGMPAKDQPFASTSPGVAAKTSGMDDGNMAVRKFDSQQRSMEQQ